MMGRDPGHLKRGFTLIELLVVFVLIGLLLTIAVPRYFHSMDSAREKVRDQNLATLRDALDKFKSDQGRYPSTLAELVQKQYLRQVPQDPVTRSDKWVALPVPGGTDAGVYDVAPPVDVAAAEAAAEAASAAATESTGSGASQ
jgi:general secretion pathway protein G